MKKQPSRFKMLVQSMLKEKGVKQEDLAKRLGISTSNLSHLLARGTSDPEIMKIIAQFLKVDISLLNTNSQIKSPGAKIQQIEKDCLDELDRVKLELQAKIELCNQKEETIQALKLALNNRV